MSQSEAYLESIRDVYPDLVIEKVHAPSQDGQFNDILVINDELIFRFPRHMEGIASLKNEVQLLGFLQGYLPLPIPNPIYSNIDTGMAGKSFMGYQIIPGEPLRRETLTAITDQKTLQRLAGQLGNFLKELHTVPLETLSKNMPVHDGVEEWKRLYSEIQANLYRLMRPDARARVSSHFEGYFNNPRLQMYTASLRHGDFGPGNILYDHKSGTISGIIDFSAAGPGDPALDIAAVSTYGEQFFTRLHTVYPEIEPMLERARFYRGTYALQEALHGFMNNDQEAFESGISKYV